MLPAYLIVALTAYSGSVQSVHAFRYASMIECSDALPKMQLNFVTGKDARLSAPMFCTDKKPGWWK